MNISNLTLTPPLQTFYRCLTVCLYAVWCRIILPVWVNAKAFFPPPEVFLMSLWLPGCVWRGTTAAVGKAFLISGFLFKTPQGEFDVTYRRPGHTAQAYLSYTQLPGREMKRHPWKWSVFRGNDNAEMVTFLFGGGWDSNPHVYWTAHLHGLMSGQTHEPGAAHGH